MTLKNIFFALVCVSSLSFADAPYKKANDVICPDKEDCMKKSTECKCWCSHKCGPRDKVLTGDNPDQPVFKMSDPEGNYCYCNQWDIDNYNRCKIPAADNNNAQNIIKD